jgi:hypothetical protein
VVGPGRVATEHTAPGIVKSAVAVPALQARVDNPGIPRVASASPDEDNALLRRHMESFAKPAKSANITPC